MRVSASLRAPTAIALLLFCVPLTAIAGSDSPEKATYLRYCSACHGESGKGDGVVSQLMRPQPTDLTKIAKANKGEFPSTRVMQIIDGRETVRAHGDPAMPIWGELFNQEQGATATGQARDVRLKVMQITDYLRSIQEK